MTEQIHEIAAKGYQIAPEAYDRGRPAYPLDAVGRLLQELKIGAHSVVVELGPGTGKFTQVFTSLLPAGTRVIAIEPVQEMRKKFASLMPSVELLAGRAENIPLAESSCDAVVSAQAFHWFDGPAALREIYRILKPGGTLGLIWNLRDESVDWVARLEQLTQVHRKDVPTYKSGRWRQAFEQTELFTPLQRSYSQYAHVGSPETVLDRVASSSYIAAMPEAERKAVLEQVRDLLSSHPQTKGEPTIEFPYVTHVFWCECKKRG